MKDYNEILNGIVVPLNNNNVIHTDKVVCTDLMFEKYSIIFRSANGEEVLKITPDGKFIAKGKEIEDVHDIYSKICSAFSIK